MDIREYIKNHKLIVDGAMGTYYAKLISDDYAICELANLTNKDIIKKIHKDYIDAGAKLIRTNTFKVFQNVLNIDAKKQKELIISAYNIAKEAKGEKKDIFIACNLGPMPQDIAMSDNDIKNEYKFICDILLNEGADIFSFETFYDLSYIEDIIKYIKDKNNNTFIILNVSIGKSGYTTAGISASRIMEMFSSISQIDACGFNCGIGSSHMYEIVRKLNFPDNKYISILPNAGYPEQIQNRMIFSKNEDYFAKNLKKIAELGVDIVGGCCGTTPNYIKKINNIIDIDDTNRGKRIQLIQKKRELKGNNEFYDLFRSKKVIAVELDPPCDANFDKLIENAKLLDKKGVDIITIADSPMGKSRVDSILTAIKLNREINMNVMPHICCRDKNMIAMRSTILGAYINGIRNFLIVTGDPVPSNIRSNTTGVFDYNSIKLMNFVKQMNIENFSNEPIFYGGALNYNRGKLENIIKRMNQKIENGAKYFLTQPIYADEDIEKIKYLKENVNTKILCGIMPLVSYRNANFIKNEVAGINVPDEIVKRYSKDMSKEQAEIIGAEIANEIIEKLSNFADGYYFMLPFNRVSLMDKLKF